MKPKSKFEMKDVIAVSGGLGQALSEHMQDTASLMFAWQAAAEDKDVLSVLGAGMQISLAAIEQMAKSNLEEVNEDWTKDGSEALEFEDLFSLYVSAIGLVMVNTARSGQREAYAKETATDA